MKTIKVQVKMTGRHHGFIGNRRVYDGDIIDVPETQFSSKWMKRLRKERVDKPKVTESPSTVD